MTIFVCGASGYVGSNLLKAHPECVPVPRMGLPDAKSGDTIINLAAYGLQPHQTDIVTMVNVNTLYPIQLYDTMSAGARMIHCCSYSERHVPDYMYCRTKAIATKHLRGKATLAWVHTPFGGINDPTHRFMPTLIKTAREGGTFHVEHRGATRDLIHVSRVCEGLMRLANESEIMEVDLGAGPPALHQSHVALRAKALVGDKLTITFGNGTGGDILGPSRSPYIQCDFSEDFRKEILG